MAVEGAVSDGMKAVAGPVVQIDEGSVQAHLDEVVWSTVEETLNALLDAEEDRVCGARKHERTEGRKDTRSDSYDRKLGTKAGEVRLSVPKLREMRLAKAAKIVESGIDETLNYYCIPPEHWRSIRTNNPMERLNREIRRRTRFVVALPDSHSALMLVAARLRHAATTKWGTKRYLQMNRLDEVRAIA